MNKVSSPYQSFGNPELVVAQQRTYMTRVYGWMCVGLVFTALAAWYTLSQDYLSAAIMSNGMLRLGLIVV